MENEAAGHMMDRLEQPKDYRLALRVRNNLLLTAMERRGIYSLPQLAEMSGASYGTVASLAALTLTGRTKAGEWRAPLQRISKFLRCLPEDLMPEQHWDEPLAKRTGEVELSLEEARLFIGEWRPAAELPDNGILAEERTAAITAALDSLTPRKADILAHRFGLGGVDKMTLDELGKKYDLSSARVREIEMAALDNLRGRRGYGTGYRISKDVRERLRGEVDTL